MWRSGKVPGRGWVILGFGDFESRIFFGQKSSGYGLGRRLRSSVTLSPWAYQGGSEILLRNGLKGLKLN